MDMSEWAEDGPDWYEPGLPDAPEESPESPPAAEETPAEALSSSESPAPVEAGEESEPPAEAPEVEEPADEPSDVPPLPEDESGGGDPPVPVDAGEEDIGSREPMGPEFSDEAPVTEDETDDASLLEQADEWVGENQEYDSELSGEAREFGQADVQEMILDTIQESVDPTRFT